MTAATLLVFTLIAITVFAVAAVVRRTTLAAFAVGMVAGTYLSVTLLVINGALHA